MWKKLTIKWSIRLRITLLVTLLLLSITLLFTGFGVASGRRHFDVVPLSRSFTATMDASVIYSEAIPMETRIALPSHGEQTPDDYADSVTLAAVTVAQKAQKSFGSDLIWMLVGINCLGVLGVYWILGRALKPLTRLSDEMERIHEHTLDYSLPQPPNEDEVGSLTRSFNGMLARLHQSFSVQKNFAANAAHELKTPLTVLKSSLQVLALDENPTPEDYQETTTLCGETVEQMIALVEDLLRIGSLQEEEVRPVDFAELIAQVIKGQSETVENGVTLQAHCSPLVRNSQPTLLLCIVENLISNAIKYNRPNGTVTVTLAHAEEAVTLTVSDTGIGISKEDLPHIFESFYRADPSRSKNIPGNGLGLQIVAIATEHLGGQLHVTSEIGIGTQVCVRFPD